QTTGGVRPRDCRMFSFIGKLPQLVASAGYWHVSGPGTLMQGESGPSELARRLHHILLRRTDPRPDPKRRCKMADNVKRNIDNAADKAKDFVDKGRDKAEEWTEKAGHRIEEAGTKVGNQVKDAGRKMGEKIKDATH